ncbi:MAG: tryptophan--tRNA ligase, partial [Nitrososphaerota archaeon]|nr:tryptophan--tRNA ligase [Nitrososphaerota archaeon]
MSSLDPWGISNIKDYERLCEEFGVSKLDQDLLNVLIDNKYVRRKIVFGHRDIKQFIQLGNNGQDVAIMSGIKPTGVFHLGNKITVDQIVYF